MCRNIKTLFNFEPPATDAEVRDAALQFVRKLSGATRPSQRNQAAFEAHHKGTRQFGIRGCAQANPCSPADRKMLQPFANASAQRIEPGVRRLVQCDRALAGLGADLADHPARQQPVQFAPHVTH